MYYKEESIKNASFANVMAKLDVAFTWPKVRYDAVEEVVRLAWLRGKEEGKQEALRGRT